MRMKSLSIILMLLVNISLFSQKGGWPTAGAKSLGMGTTGITTTGMDALFLNQAGLVDVNSLSIMASSESRFALINSVGLGIAAPIQKIGTFGLALSNYGTDQYSEQKIGLAYGRKLAKNTSIGAQFEIFNTNINGFGNAALATFEIGLLTKILKNVYLGVHVFSPAQIAITDEENIPSRIRLGLKYLPSEKVEIQAEYDQFIDFSPTVKLGVSYALLEYIHLRAGYNSNSSGGNFSFGLGYDWKNVLVVDGAVWYHEFLGFTPGLSITYSGKRKDKE